MFLVTPQTVSQSVADLEHDAFIKLIAFSLRDSIDCTLLVFTSKCLYSVIIIQFIKHAIPQLLEESLLGGCLLLLNLALNLVHTRHLEVQTGRLSWRKLVAQVSSVCGITVIFDILTAGRVG